MLPVALRALASRNGFPCCVRRSRTEVTATINHTSSLNGSSGMGILPFMNYRSNRNGKRSPLAHKLRTDFIKSRPDKISRSGKNLFEAATQLLEFDQYWNCRF